MRVAKVLGLVALLTAGMAGIAAWWSAPAPYDPLSWCHTMVRLDPALNLLPKDPTNAAGTICLAAQTIDRGRGAMPGLMPSDDAIAEAKAIWRRSR